jgi:hypothetical protein
MSVQTEVQEGIVRLPADAALIALGTAAEGRGCHWDPAGNDLLLCAVDTKPEFIVDDVHASDNTASVIPFTPERNYRVRVHDTITSALALGDLMDIDNAGAGLFNSGGATSDVNVGRCEDPAVGGGLALIRPLMDAVVS